MLLYRRDVGVSFLHYVYIGTKVNGTRLKMEARKIQLAEGLTI